MKMISKYLIFLKQKLRMRKNKLSDCSAFCVDKRRENPINFLIEQNQSKRFFWQHKQTDEHQKWKSQKGRKSE